MTDPGVIRTAQDITAEWLGAVLGERLEIDSTAAVGTGQMSLTYRVAYHAAGGHGSVIIKLAATDPGSRATGVGMGAYRREVEFYRQLSGRIGDPLPTCHAALHEETEGWFSLVLEDVAEGRTGDQIAGCGVEEARAAIGALARIHAPVLGDLAVGSAPFLNVPSPLTQQLATALLPGFLERYGERVAPAHAEVCRRFIAVLDAWAADRRPPLGIVHGDYRLDNLLFTPEGGCKAVDWQTVSWGSSLTDLSYFIGGGLEPTDRRAHERELVELYHGELLAAGATGISADECWEEYRRRCFHGILMTVVAAMVVQRTDRGDEMFMTWLRRNAEQVLDLDALELLPEPSTARPVALQPTATDEGRHPPSAEEWFNESWYFDGVRDDGSLGVYWRLGRVPNQDLALVTASIVGPGRPSIMLVAQVPLPDAADDEQRVAVEGLSVTHHCEEPLVRYRVVLEGTGQRFEDPAAVLRDEDGRPIDIAFDLVWKTDGVPYQWRQSTRYEIPCRVSGRVRIDGETFEFAGPGQRDHSWGARDWFAVDWMWSGLHLEDGTHVHAVGVPQMPGVGVGYVQREGEVTEIETLNATEEMRADGLIETATMAIGPGGLELEIEPSAFGPILLKSPDGRTSHFPRAMCRVRAADGRTGQGWIEWNRVQRVD